MKQQSFIEILFLILAGIALIKGEYQSAICGYLLAIYFRLLKKEN